MATKRRNSCNQEGQGFTALVYTQCRAGKLHHVTEPSQRSPLGITAHLPRPLHMTGTSFRNHPEFKQHNGSQRQPSPDSGDSSSPVPKSAGQEHGQSHEGADGKGGRLGEPEVTFETTGNWKLQNLLGL